MEEKILILNLKLYPYATPEQLKTTLDEMVRTDSREMVLFPCPDKGHLYLGVLLDKYYTPALADTATVRSNQTEGKFRYLTISRTAMRAFLQHLTRKMDPAQSAASVSELAAEDDPFDLLLDTDDRKPQPAPIPPDPMMQFLMDNTPAQIQRKLDEQVIGQRDLTQAVADFLYYHALRQQHPELPQRPLLIAGPSGSGKTEVWRAASKLYGHIFQIQIIDGSNLTCDGWAGNYKLSTFVTTKFAKGGILVVDEFDKLVKPKYASGGDNVAMQMQAEFLKLFEGEHHVTENKRQTNVTSKMMGFVLVGAFEDLRDQKAKRAKNGVSSIGFHADRCGDQTAPSAASYRFSDEEFISYGIMPEIVGRIAAKCATQPLDETAYLNILRGAHSRVAMIERVLLQYGIQAADVISLEELKAMIAQSQTNRTGVRWVSAQVENRLLEAIREQGLFPDRQTPAAFYPKAS